MPTSKPAVLATDLDGTLIPLDPDSQQQNDLQVLDQSLNDFQVPLLYVTGRHWESVQTAQSEHQLPSAAYIICDVGTTILRRCSEGTYQPLPEYQAELKSIVGEFNAAQVSQLCQGLEQLERQEEEKQGPFKVSFYTDQHQISEISKQLQALLESHQAPWSITSSVDPFNGDGLIDLLPFQASKAYALRWWAKLNGLDEQQIVFAGDSGNDYAAFISGFRCILVNNTAEEIVNQVAAAHKEAGWIDRLFHASQRATSGVLEGCQAYKLFPSSVE